MEDEIDLRPYLRALVKRWYWIVLPALILAALAAASSSRQQPIFTATAAVLFRSTQSELKLEERFVTSEATDIASRLRTLLTLAKSSTVEAEIPSETLKRLAPGGYTVGSLASRISVKSDGDLIMITASALTPEQAQDLANTWATSFVSSANELYRNKGAGGGADAQADDLQQRLVAAQETYERFLGANRISELDQRIAAVEGVLEGSLKADEQRYNAYLARAQQLDVVLRDAEALRTRIADGRSIGPGENLTALLLQAQAVSGGLASNSEASSPPPASPAQLQFNVAGVTGQDQGVTLRNLDAFIETLREQVVSARTAATEIGTALAKDARAPESSLGAEQRARAYAELAELTRQREAEEGKRKALEQERDLSLEAVEIVRRKQTEQRVATVQPDAEVSLAWEALKPTAPITPGTVRQALIGGLAGAVLGTILVLLAELVGVRLPRTHRPSSIERRADYPSST